MPITSAFSSRTAVQKTGNPYHGSTGLFTSKDKDSDGNAGIEPIKNYVGGGSDVNFVTGGVGERQRERDKARTVEVKSHVKNLKLPGGKATQVSSDGYEWSQRGGYIDKTWERIRDSTESAGFKEVGVDTALGSADGGQMGNAITYRHESGWELRLDTSYGSMASSNRHHITLSKGAKKCDLVQLVKHVYSL